MEEFRQRVLELHQCDTMDYQDYYVGYNLLEMNDLDNTVPEIFICSGNRTAGKTFFFKRFVVRYCLKYHRKFLLVTRKRTQVKSALESFITDLNDCEDFYNLNLHTDRTETSGVRGLYIGKSDEPIAYATYYNFAADLKEASNMFGDVDILFKDEMQVETGDYLEDEVQKLRSIHKSISRGFGKRVRYVACILCSNEISVINPYYLSLGITDRIDSKTKKMRGNGWVFERTFNETASKESAQSGFERAFGQDAYSLSSNYNVYLDNDKMVGKLNTAGFRYAFTFKCLNKTYGLWYNNSCYYVSKKIEPNFKIKYAADIDSHDETTTLLNSGNVIIKTLIELFNKGGFRFESLECKSACLKLLGRYY